ncbi:hypothetical protein LPJ66_006084 [Kickxella alabastrina]|uniref:Uncharacterized protein n=1 Tax=Kickxella alabastrina TaxID=61397 RepID=A0ACC1IIS8_9FUNG|nr:hypothetical protein LPJ66_006084 [Kickxella alabastrina]
MSRCQLGYAQETDRLLSDQPPVVYSSTISAAESIAESTQSSRTAASRSRSSSAAITTMGVAWSAVPSEIDNKGSTARDFYAAERNYLSWLRLSMAIMSMGAVALVGFRQPSNTSPNDKNIFHSCYWLKAVIDGYNHYIGLALFFLAVFTGLAAMSVFYHTHAQLAVQQQPLRWSGMLLISVTFATALASFSVAMAAFCR